MIEGVFVYGTLKRGGLREGCWPIAPRRVTPGWIVASLYDVGPYPAIGPGPDCVLGELWWLEPDDLPRTLEVLDAVEGYSALGRDNEYSRLETCVTWFDANRQAPGESCGQAQAYVYQLARLDRLASLRRIHPWLPVDDRLCAAWPDPKARVPRTFEE